MITNRSNADFFVQFLHTLTLTAVNRLNIFSPAAQERGQLAVHSVSVSVMFNHRFNSVQFSVLSH